MIHVLCADISRVSPERYEQLYAEATEERRKKADSLSRQEDKLRCLTCDALLRAALGREDYVAARTEAGKPYLPEDPGFHFNLSHAGCWVVLAHGGSPVGVDVEEHRKKANISGLCRRYFTEDEQGYVTQDPENRFYRIWTAKESYLKFLGTGLQKDLRSFSVLSPEPGIHYVNHPLSEGYTLTLCTTETDVTFEVMSL